MSGPKTTWEDLAHLGWYKNDVYNTLNRARGNSMEGIGDMAMNTGFALDWGWYSYNVTIGTPRLAGSTPSSHDEETTIWSVDNTQNTESFGPVEVEDTWTDSSSASLTVSRRAEISLSQSITIEGVASSEFSITVAAESSETVTKESRHESTQKWEISVAAGERVQVVRVRHLTMGHAIYDQDYGLSDKSMIATKGKKWQGHYYWGLRSNAYLNYPKGTMQLNGTKKTESFTYRIIRERPDGKRTTEPLPPPEGDLNPVVRMSNECGAALPNLVPGVEK